MGLIRKYRYLCISYMKKIGVDIESMNRREWLKAAAGAVVAAVATPLSVAGEAAVSASDGDSEAPLQLADAKKGGASGRVKGVSIGDSESSAGAGAKRRKVGKIAVREAVGCVECDACMPCGYGVDIPGNFKFYNEMLARGGVPDTETDDVTGSDFRRKAIGFLRAYDRRIADKHQSQRCIKCFHCVSECRHGVFIVNELAELTALTDALRDWECRYL